MLNRSATKRRKTSTENYAGIQQVFADASASSPLRGAKTAARVRLTLVGGEVAWQA